MTDPGPLVVGITGASGAAYAHRLVDSVTGQGIEVHVVPSTAGLRVLREELGLPTRGELFPDLSGRPIRYFSFRDIGAPFCSGSFRSRGVVVVPCTMGTLGAIAGGVTDNAITRAAEVALKEGRKCILVPRETPLSVIHLENQLRAARAGAVILPPTPAFYNHPRTLEDQINFIVSRILDALGIDNELCRRWPVNPERRNDD